MRLLQRLVDDPALIPDGPLPPSELERFAAGLGLQVSADELREADERLTRKFTQLPTVNSLSTAEAMKAMNEALAKGATLDEARALYEKTMVQANAPSGGNMAGPITQRLHEIAKLLLGKGDG